MCWETCYWISLLSTIHVHVLLCLCYIATIRLTSFICSSLFLTANNRPATVTVRVGNNRPDLGVNQICNKFTGFIEEGRPLFLPCARPMPGAFVSVHLESPGNPLSICEAFVYTDHGMLYMHWRFYSIHFLLLQHDIFCITFCDRSLLSLPSILSFGCALHFSVYFVFDSFIRCLICVSEYKRTFFTYHLN